MSLVLPVWELGPTKLPSAGRALRANLRRRGLLLEDGVVDLVDMERIVQTLEKHLKSGVGSMKRAQRSLVPCVTWCANQKQAKRAWNLLLMWRTRHGTLPGTAWWAAVTELWHPNAVGQLDQIRPPESRLARLRKSGLVPKDLRAASLPGRVAGLVVARKLRLAGALAGVKVRAGSALGDAVLRVLLDDGHRKWIGSHSRRHLGEFMTGTRDTVWVGHVVNSILWRYVQRGAKPGDLAEGTKLGGLVEWLRGHMPTDERHAAWEALKPGCRQLFKWLEVQRDMARFFKEWHAETEREQFWLGYVGSIRDLRPIPRGGALAMRIGDYWFVEIGKTTFAAYAHRMYDFEECEDDLLAARRPDLVRDVHSKRWRLDLVERKVHTNIKGDHRWRRRFQVWIEELTGCLPDDR